MTRSRYRSSPFPVALLLAVLLVPLSGAARATPDGASLCAAEFDGDGSPRPARGVTLPPTFLPIELGSPDDDLLIRCSVQATLDGKPKKGVKVTLDGEIVDNDGETVATFSESSKTTKRNSGWDNPHELAIRALVDTFFPVPGEGFDGLDYLAAIRASSGSGKEVDTLALNCSVGRPSECVELSTTGCLHGGRFEVEVDWLDPFDGSDRQAQVQTVDGSTLIFDFFPLANEELLLKVLDECHEPFGHFWVFYSSTTNVEYTVTVTDTETGLWRDYGPPVPPLEAITDTQAFATCP